MKIHATFEGTCPNCGGPNTDLRLLYGLPCDKCLPDIDEVLEFIKKVHDPLEVKLYIVNKLKELGTLKNYEQNIVKLELETKKVAEFFKRAIGNDPWSAQKTWIKRVLEGRSFCILAPTGVGKTVFGMIMSLYLASLGKKCYIILPTTVLVKQVGDRIEEFKKKLNLNNVRVIAYHTALSVSKKRELQQEIIKGDFDILVTTSQYLARNFEELRKHKFDFIFVDDVDALLKSSKNIDRVLELLGFTPEVIKDALNLIFLKRRIAFYIVSKQSIPEELSREFKNVSERVKKFIEQNKFGILVVSTATGRVRGTRSKIFRELLGFEVGSRAELLRNIYDTYLIPEGDIISEVIKLVKVLGTGGLIFVPVDLGVEYAKIITEELNKHGINAKIVYAEEKSAIDEFIKGDVDILVGVAIYYGLLVRGLDLPERIRYAIFAGIPRFKFSLKIKEQSPLRLLGIAMNIREYLTKEDAEELDSLMLRIRRLINTLGQKALIEVTELLKEGKTESNKKSINSLLQATLQLRDFLRNILSKREFIEKLKESKYISVKEENGELYLYIPDTMTYLQASGRTSRMFAGGISKGLSVVIVDDKKLLNGLIRQTKWYSEDIQWFNFKELDLKKVIEEIDRDRALIKALREGRISELKGEPIKTALMIVESPNKARTISNFYGRPSKKRIGNLVAYEVSTGGYILNIIASGGHVFDLVTKKGFHGIIRQDGTFIPVYTTIKKCKKCGTQFTDLDQCPVCKSKDYFDTIEVIKVLRELAKEVDMVLIGTDPDTEGEKIGWDIAVALAPYVPKIKRIEFHEITKRAISDALNNLREINLKLVEAQIVRRVEDRWIGFVLSQKLWKAFESRWLSAGRVQTPVLAWIVERYHEHLESRKYVFRVLLSNGYTLTITDLDIKDRKKAEEFAESILGKKCEILEVKDEEITIPPPPPFSTDSMLREAVRVLRIGVDEIMRLAQDLFELGLITYHRTDSTRVSLTGRYIARDYISEKFGEEYFVGREWMKEGAHECIRPTRPIDVDKLRELIREGIITLARPLTRRHYMLYDLIFRRFMASQMKEAVVLKRTIRLRIGEYETSIEGYVNIIKDGFTKVYIPFELMPQYEWKDVEVKDVKYRKIATVPLYTQADIIRLMKEKGIGRPSTYAKIIKTLLDRGYVIETKNKKLVPTKRGIEVLRFLMERYEKLINEERTRLVEEMMDKVEKGEVDYQAVLKEFYKEIYPIAISD